MLYCLIENGQIVEGPKELPKNTSSVSNFYLLPDEILRQYGWLPYTFIDNPLPNQVKLDTEIIINETEVIETQIYREKTLEEIELENQKKIKNKWSMVRNKRNILLRECDWTQLSDAPVNNSQWTQYRQLLREIPQTFSDPDSVVWPTKPS